MYTADLISRSIAFVGVFIALILFGFLNDINFQVQIQESYSSLVLNLNQSSIVKTDNPNILPAKTLTEKNNQKLAKDEKKSIKDDRQKDIIKKSPLKSISNDKVLDSKQKIIEKKQEQDRKKTNKKNVSKNEKSGSYQKDTNTNLNSVSKNTNSVKSVAPTTNAINVPSISDQLFNKIQDEIDYPKRAIKRKIQGVVLVEFTITNGKVTSFMIVKSSGHTLLDKSASKLCDKLIGLDTKHPNSNMKVHMPIKYALI